MSLEMFQTSWLKMRVRMKTRPQFYVFDIYSWAKVTKATKHSPPSHDVLLTSSLGPHQTWPTNGSLVFYFTPALEKLLRAKKRSCPDSLSEWADFLRARVTWRLLDLAVNNVCGGVAGRCWCTPALPVNSIQYHGPSPRTVCRVEPDTATRSFFNEQTWMCESECMKWQPRAKKRSS